MPIIYNVIISETEKENCFQVTWHNVEMNAQDSFMSHSAITPQESQLLWQQPSYQLDIGQKLFRFLDGDARHLSRALDQADRQGEPLLVYLYTDHKTADWPFELLARDNTFILTSQLHLVRCVSNRGAGKILPPENRPLKLLFMASSPLDGAPKLAYELEEEMIFKITSGMPIDMEVEDSGSLEGLCRRLEQKQYDVVYLTGHANIDRNKGPYFLMEDETGREHKVFPDTLWDEALINNPPRLLFLSGCRTGETFNRLENIHLVSFARLMVEHFLPAVLGWGRSVCDDQASHAGKMLFHELCRGQSIRNAVMRVRFELQKDFPGSSAPAWPLLRLFSNGLPMDAIVTKGQRCLPRSQDLKYSYLGNNQIKVPPQGFVGRRRELQSGLQTLKQNNNKVGILILGPAGSGKTSLAGKFCERFPDHNLIVVNGQLNAISLQAALHDAFIVAQDQNGQTLLSQKKEMTEKLANLCVSSFKEKNYLLVLDAFEQNLEGTENEQQQLLKFEAAELLSTLLHYLPFNGKMTQVIITSRYPFSLSRQNVDMVEERLEKIWLTAKNI